jgi:hypothetical protein
MPTATTPAASGAGGRNNAKSQHQGESVNQTPGYPDPSNKKATSTSLTLDTPFAVEPMWLTELLKKYLGGVANVFVLEGNTHDYYQYMGEKLRGCLVSTLTSKQLASGNPLFGVVVTFSRYARFAFPTDGMRDKFLEIANKQATTVKLPTTLTADNLNTLVGQYGMSFAMAVLTNVLAYKGKEAVPVAIILEYADTLVPASEGALGEQDRTIYTALSDIAKDQIVGAAGNLGRQHHLVVMVSEEPNGLYAPLRRTIREVLTIPMPDGVLRTAFIPVVKASHRKVGLAEGLSDHKLANLTAGLTLRQIEDIFLIAAKEGQAVDVPLVRKRKDELIKNEYGDVLTITDPRMSFAGLGGMTTIKAYLTDKVVRPMQAGKLKRVPNGLLLSGPAGTGKTALAEALAGEIGTSFVKFNIAKIKDKYVGQSERNMQRALDMLEVINPAVIFIDELDQTA